jgi:hypothetical protein
MYCVSNRSLDVKKFPIREVNLILILTENTLYEKLKILRKEAEEGWIFKRKRDRYQEISRDIFRNKCEPTRDKRSVKTPFVEIFHA